MLQDCAKDLGTNKSRTKGAKRIKEIQMNGSVLYSTRSCGTKEGLSKIEEETLDKPFPAIPAVCFLILGIPEVWFYTRRKLGFGFTR